jgi:hypothetical protein
MYIQNLAALSLSGITNTSTKKTVETDVYGYLVQNKMQYRIKLLLYKNFFTFFC